MRLARYGVTIVFTMLFGTGLAIAQSEYLGAWQNVSNPQDTFVVTANGANFLITQSGRPTPAIFQNGQLILYAPFGQVPIAHVKANDTLILAGETFRRLR